MSFERRIALAIPICVLIWIAFDFFSPKPPPEELTEDAAALAEKSEDGSPASAEAEDGKATGDAKPDAPSSDGPEAAQGAAPTREVEVVHHEIRNDTLALQVTNRAPGRGGVVEGIHLLSEQFAGHDTATNALDLGGAATFEVSFADENSDFRIPGNQSFAVQEATDTAFVLVHRGDDVEVKQRWELLEGYQGKLTVEVINHSDQEQRHRLHLRTRVGISGEESRYNIKRGLCRTTEDLEEEDNNDVEDGVLGFKDPVQWAGVDNKYFGSLVVPTETFADCDMSLSDDGGFLVGRMGSSVATLASGERKTYEMGLFIGAKELELLQAFDAVETGAEIHLEEAIDWGMLGALSEFLGRMLLTLMRFFHGWVGVWGWAIVLLTIVIKLMTLPLTLKQMASMKAMKRIQPKIAALKEKYGDDRAKQGQEMQALFAREGVNPLAGCLPLVVQMPIWFALYSMLGAAVELVHEPFLWLPDLTKQDPFFALPIALGGMMVVQNRMMPTTGDEMQAKMMRWIMPVVFTAFMLFLPSGLGVYIFVNICLSVVQTAIQVGRNKDEPAAEPKPAKKK